MRFFLKTILLFLLPFSLQAQPLFEEVYGTSYDEQGKAIVPALDGGFYLAGTTTDTTFPYQDIYLVKTDSTGNEQWSRFYNGRGDENVYDILRHDSSLWMLALTQNVPWAQRDVYFLKLNLQGDTIWTKKVGATGNNDNERAVDMKLLNDSTLLFGGATTTQSVGGWDFYFLRMDTSGNVLWDTSYGGVYKDYVNRITSTHDGNYVFTGRSQSYGPGNNTAQGRNFNIYLAKLDTNGDTLWTHTYGDSIGEDAGIDLYQASDSGFYVLSEEGDPVQGSQLTLIRTDKTGKLLWQKVIGRQYGEKAYDMAFTDDSNFLVTGYTQSPQQNSEVLLIKVDQSGDTLWSVTYGGTNNEVGYGVSELPNKDIIMVGESEGFGQVNFDAYLIRVDSLGNIGCPDELGFSLSDTAACPDNLVLFNNLTVGSGGFNWLVDDTVYNSINAAHWFDSAGSYSVTLATCADTTVGQVEINALPNTDFTYQIDSTDPTKVQFFSDGDSANFKTFHWNFGDLSGEDSSNTSPVHEYDSMGAYHVSFNAVSLFGCQNQITKTINLFDALDAVQISETAADKIHLYPHPVRQHSKLLIRNSKQTTYRLTIYNNRGEVVQQYADVNTQIQLSRSDFSSGFYIFRLTDKAGRALTGKFIVQ